MPVDNSTVRVTAANLVLGILHIFWLAQVQPPPDQKNTYSRSTGRPLSLCPVFTAGTVLLNMPVLPVVSMCTSLLPTMFTYCSLFRASGFCLASYRADLSNAPYCRLLVSVLLQFLFHLASWRGFLGVLQLK